MKGTKLLHPLILSFVLIASLIQAQDTLVLNNGSKIIARHIHIRDKVFYRHYDSGIKDSIKKSEVNYVIHSSGWKIAMVPPPWLSPLIISPGIGLSAIQYLFKDYRTDTGAGIISQTPVYAFNLDYNISQTWCFGIGISWQMLKINPYVSFHDSLIYGPSLSYVYYPNYPHGGARYVAYYPTPPAGGPNSDVIETLTRINLGARILYHIRNDDVVDFYLGGRLGISLWNDQSNPAGFSSEGEGTKISIQALIGMRREIDKYFGIYIEGGIGTPYFGLAGLYLKLNTKKQ